MIKRHALAAAVAIIAGAAATALAYNDPVETSYSPGGTDVALADGGTNKSITAAAGAVVWCDADSFELTAAGTTGQVLTSTGSSAPVFGTSVAALNVNSPGADADTQIQTDTNGNAVTVDAGAFGGVGAVSFGATVPSSTLASVTIDPPAMTATSNANYAKLDVQNANTVSTATGTTAPVIASVFVGEPNITLGGGGATCAIGAGLYVEAAPSECTANAAIYADGLIRTPIGLYARGTGTSNYVIIGGSAGTSYFGVKVDGQPFVQVLASNFQISAGVLQYTSSTITVGAGATTFAVGRGVHVVDCDALGNTIGTITGGPAADSTNVTLRFVDASCTITDTGTDASNTVNLSAAFTSSDDDMLLLNWDGTSWREVARSVN